MRSLKFLFLEGTARAINMSPRLRRWLWRAGRSLYCLARGESRADDMRVDGELDLQGRVIEANGEAACFVAFDIGANQGDWTLALIGAFEARDGSTARLDAHVFEPVPATRERLGARLAGKSLESIHINGFALSDKTGTFDMAVMSETGGTNSLVYDAAMAKEAIGFVTVPLTTLDLYCAEAGIDHIDIVKCDTEGHDLCVLRGAADLLKSGRIDVFQFEYNHRWINARAFLKDVFDLIEGLPYRLGRVMPQSIEIFDAWHPELEKYYHCNYVLVRCDIVKGLPTFEGTFDQSNVYSRLRRTSLLH